MDNLHILMEYYNNGYNLESLDFFSLSAIFCAILIIVTKNPIISVLFLIGLFLSISCYLLLLGLNFIGLSYLLVYVGAVSILFLFILMLINVRVSELLSNTSSSIPLVIIVALSFSYPIQALLPYSILPSQNILYSDYIGYFDNTHGQDIFFSTTTNKLYLVTSNMWDGYLSEISHIGSIGNIMYTSHSIWLILTSIILLLAMVGAIVITIKQKI